MYIDKTAIIEKGAELGKDVSVGPYSVIESGTEIGDGTRVLSHAIIRNGARIGADCVIYQGTVLGGEPQDVKFEGEESYLKIGDGTTIREYVTAHRADGEGESTLIGANCTLMAYCHVAHNCRVGDGVTMANLCTLGGFVEVGDGAFLGGLAAVHQFCRIGDYVMLGGGSIILADVPPFMTVAGGYRPPVVGLNTLGLTRAGFSAEARSGLKKAYRIIFRRGLRIAEAAQKLKEELPGNAEAEKLATFLETAERGICTAGEPA